MADPVTAMMVASTAIGAIQKQSQARSQAKRQQAAVNRQIQQKHLEQEVREKQQREQTKQQQATARAAFGASGVSSASGSSGAVVDGIAARTDEAIADNRRLSDFGIETLRENQRATRRSNLLEQRNSILNTVVGTANKAVPKIFSSSPSGAFGTGNHPGER